MEDDYFPNIGSPGSLHDLHDDREEPRLWFAKSVSKAGAIALQRPPTSDRAPVGFHSPRALRDMRQ